MIGTQHSPQEAREVQVAASVPLPEQLRLIREARGKTLLDLAATTGLSRLTASAAEGKNDPRLSTIVALFDALGYTLLPAPKHLASEVASFINNGARQLALPAGASAPLSVGQRSFLDDGDDAGGAGAEPRSR